MCKDKKESYIIVDAWKCTIGEIVLKKDVSESDGRSFLSCPAG